MRKKVAWLIWILILSVGLWSSPEKVTSCDVVDAAYSPVSLDYASTIKLLPKKLRPSGTTPHRCLILLLTLRCPDTGEFYPLRFDRYLLSLGPTETSSAVPAVGLGVGPLPVNVGDPQEKWTDHWEIGKSEGSMMIQGRAEANPQMKLLFLVPLDVTQVSLLEKKTDGKTLVIKEGIVIPASDRP